MSDSRAAFEAWAGQSGWDLARLEDGSYRTMSTDAAWGGWQARDAEIDKLRSELAAVRSKTIEECAKVCDARVFALDHGSNQYRREASASQCAEAIRQLEKP